jgi:RNA polymerase sigma factor (sigma-70 family)
MSKTALVQILGRWAGAHECDPDAALVARFLTERDEDAFAALVHRHGPLIYGTCLRVLGNRSDADDAFQAAFFVLARRAAALGLDRGIGPWLHGVALRVAKKLRGQILQRRLREMAAAKSERVEAAEPGHDFWPVVDEELARLPLPLREVLLLCDLGGQSHAQAAKSLGLAKGTVTKRLANARGELATRLRRRGVTLGVGAFSALTATLAPAAVPAALMRETARQAVAFSAGQVGGSLTAKALAEGVMRSLNVGGFKVWLAVGLLVLTLAGGGLMLAGGPADPGGKKPGRPPARAAGEGGAAKAMPVWKESYAVEYPDSLPVSVAFSADGKTLLTGDTGGEVMALQFTPDDPQWRWKSRADGSHAAVAYSADQKHVYATTAHGVRILDAATGRDIARIDARDSNPTAVGVFPKKTIAGNITQLKVVFGNARGTFVKSWAEGNLADTVGTIETRTVAKGATPADAAAVPLAVDPKGRSAIMTGPRDATGKNVLWAYVCGDHTKGSPGNRVMVGHAATVVSAAWSRKGATAVTGDATGRVIVWDAGTMKERRRAELGGRVMAVAVSDDGTHAAAYVRGRQGGEVLVWETAKPANAVKPVHAEPADFGPEPYASLAFSPDGKRLAGCAIDKKWLRRLAQPRPAGKVRVWELAAGPKAQRPPRHLYNSQLPKGSSPNFVILDNHWILMPAAKQGAVDFVRVQDGSVQARIVLGKFVIGKMMRSSDRKWLAMEQRPAGGPAGTFEVGVYESGVVRRATIPGCGQLLAVAPGGKAVAVVRNKQVELWDGTTAKKRMAAPFKHTRIDAAGFSPDGKLLALADGQQLVLWRWEEKSHERTDMGRRVGSLAFTPDGKFLAEGPASGEDVRVREVGTRKVVRTLGHGGRRSMSVPGMATTQGGRVLIACENVTGAKEGAVKDRITLWDTAAGSVAHQIPTPDGRPCGVEVTPNGRYLVAVLDGGASGMKLGVWGLDGAKPVAEPKRPPAAARPR